MNLGRSIHIGTFFNIPVRLHWSFFLLFLWVPYLGYSEGMSIRGIAVFMVFFISLFLFVLLHEYGHSLTARRFGIDTNDIILSPIGGIARLQRLPKEPIHEVWVALAGPAVNVAIALILSLFLYLTNLPLLPGTEDISIVFEDWKNILPLMLILNLVLVIFNMIPAFPMDGGRVFRAVLSMPFGRLKATRIASLMGQVLAIAFVGWAIYSADLILVLIGIFVFVTATMEYRNVLSFHRYSESKVGDLASAEHHKLLLNSSIAEAQALMEIYNQDHFLIESHSGEIIAVLHGLFLKEAIESGDTHALVARYASPKYEKIEYNMPVPDVIDLMNREGYSILPVFKGEKYVGAVDRQILQQFLKNS